VPINCESRPPLERPYLTTLSSEGFEVGAQLYRAGTCSQSKGLTHTWGSAVAGGYWRTFFAMLMPMVCYLLGWYNTNVPRLVIQPGYQVEAEKEGKSDCCPRG
jgi:hypothetical protein